MKKSISSIILILAISISLFSQQLPLTVAEKSDYKTTSTYAEVMAFIKDLKASPSQMKIEYFATTTYGKAQPI
jgi:hypothetical protein